MIRVILAAAGGYLTMAVVVMLGTIVAAKILLPGDPLAPGQRPTPPYLAANLSVSAFAAMLGGLAARAIGKDAGGSAVAVLAGVVFLMSIASIVESRSGPSTGRPSWYLPLIALLRPLGVVAGGWLRRARV